MAPLPKAARISASSSALVGLLLAQWDSTGWLCLCNLRGERVPLAALVDRDFELAAVLHPQNQAHVAGQKSGLQE